MTVWSLAYEDFNAGEKNSVKRFHSRGKSGIGRHASSIAAAARRR